MSTKISFRVNRLYSRSAALFITPERTMPTSFSEIGRFQLEASSGAVAYGDKVFPVSRAWALIIKVVCSFKLDPQWRQNRSRSRISIRQSQHRSSGIEFS